MWHGRPAGSASVSASGSQCAAGDGERLLMVVREALGQAVPCSLLLPPGPAEAPRSRGAEGHRRKPTRSPLELGGAGPDYYRAIPVRAETWCVGGIQTPARSPPLRCAPA